MCLLFGGLLLVFWSPFVTAALRKNDHCDMMPRLTNMHSTTFDTRMDLLLNLCGRFFPRH